MKLKYLVIHATATPSGMKVTPEDIRFWHTSAPPKGRGWRQVGYSDMILLDGTLVNLVPYNDDDNVDRWEITNGVAGINSISRHVVVDRWEITNGVARINSQSRHVVYVGGTDKQLKAKDTRTPEQIQTLVDYVRRTILKHPDILVAGHNQFTNLKACPSFHVPLWLRQIGVDERNIYLAKSLV